MSRLTKLQLHRSYQLLCTTVVLRMFVEHLFTLKMRRLFIFLFKYAFVDGLVKFIHSQKVVITSI